jgi:hypothetical protein
MLARTFPRSRVWFLVGCLSLALGAGASGAFNWWPFKKKMTPPPQPVQVLGLQAPGGSVPTLLQFWERNALVLDLQGAGSSGAVVVTPPANGRWPVRISFRAGVAQFAVLEVRGAQRTVLPLRADGPSPVTLPLDHAVWTQQTPQMEISWGAASASGG